MRDQQAVAVGLRPPYDIAAATKPIRNRNVSEAVLQTLRNKQVVRYEDVKSDLDCLLIKLGWAYDFNFAASLAILRRRGYFTALGSMLPQVPALLDVRRRIEAHIDQVLETQGQCP